MALSSDLISQFVKISNDDPKPKTEATVYGKVVIQDDSTYVQLDGSDQLTPANSTADVKDGQRVTVMIKNHTAIITGNMDDPSASSTTVKEQGTKISEFDILIADRITTSEFVAEQGRIDSLVTETLLVKEKLVANEGYISELTADVVTINKTLIANEGRFETLETTKLSADVADLKFATIGSLDVTNAAIHNLSVTYGDFEQLTTNRLIAAEAFIDSADVKYMNLDFANVDDAVIKNFYSKFGMIENVVFKDATATGKIVGVEIQGDVIVAETIKADKLVVQGKDGLYYKLNVNAMGVVEGAEEVPTDSLHGSVLTPKSVVAETINVTDLEAFGATIGGFHITSSALYSGVKNSGDNTTEGVYLDSEGQFHIGDTSNYLRYIKNDQGVFELALSIGNRDMRTAIEVLEDNIRNLVVGKDGSTAMVQNGDGWSFYMGDITDSIGKAEDDIDELNKSVKDLNDKTSYIKIGETDEGDPKMVFGTSINDFSLEITNKKIAFKKGSSEPAWIDSEKLTIEKAEVQGELQFGNFVWKKRDPGGNMGVIWVAPGEVNE